MRPPSWIRIEAGWTAFTRNSRNVPTHWTKHEAERIAAIRRDAAESSRKAAQTELDALRSAALRLDGEADVLRARGRQIEEQSRHFEQRRERLEAERRELLTSLRQQEIEDLTREVEQSEAEAGALATRIELAAERQRSAQLRLQEDRHALDAVRAELHTAGGRQSSLELLQQHAMGKDRAGLSPWLEQMALRDAPRLAECLDVSAGWEDAVERVLGVHLEALCVSDAAPYLGHLHEIAEAESVAFQEMRPAGRNGAAPEALPRLVDQIQSPWDLHPVLGSVFCAPDLMVAREVSGRIASHESVVTPSGERVGPGWVMIRRPDDGKAGVLRRERDLRETKDLLQSLGERSRILETSIEDHARELADADGDRKALETAARELDRRILGLKNTLHELRARSEQAQRRLEQVDRELAEVDAVGTELDESRLENIESSRSVELRIAATAEHVQTLAARQAEAEREFDETAAALYEAQSILRREQARHDTLQSSEQLTVAHLERARTHCEEAAARLQTLRGRFDQDRPLDEERERLDACRAERQVLEQRLAEMRRGIAEIDRRIRALNDERGGAEQRIDALKERIEKARIELEGDQVRLQTLEEQFEPLGLSPTEIGEEPDADERPEAELQQDLQRLADDLSRLGPVNLMALEEYNEAKERLDHLDEQYADLSESLATLRQAIDKIDRECRALFRETYDRINGGFQRMFPKLFGGGSASLDLTEREVLDAGVTVMARPPGKRNSSIHLLSGGEKALTAVALVFAIFELNPAPFCLLDEVDAPLDDANVGRFCGLVKEMSERVQFLFISHNKATMEIAQYLAGVTMKEPGVSRIVAVDLGEAVEMITA
ncbi:MAG: chromosome segregation protein SMC [Methylotetracoccus sp.]